MVPRIFMEMRFALNQNWFGAVFCAPKKECQSQMKKELPKVYEPKEVEGRVYRMWEEQ